MKSRMLQVIQESLAHDGADADTLERAVLNLLRQEFGVAYLEMPEGAAMYVLEQLAARINVDDKTGETYHSKKKETKDA
jgi:hypothetical protein